MGQTIGLSQLPRLLSERTGRPVSYQALYRRIVDGHLPAERSPAGRWLISADDLPVYVAAITAKKRKAE